MYEICEALYFYIACMGFCNLNAEDKFEKYSCEICEAVKFLGKYAKKMSQFSNKIFVKSSKPWRVIYYAEFARFAKVAVSTLNINAYL